ncbi:S66 family peptidase [Liquorilactobacillus aquaticus]|uniref:S66 family peptidase n=1 Tax=Liquorilactobacillus aquaticus TaxID=392566 RepID=UPI00070EEBF2|nr:S66 peptidase family protein [Liquorilactobacillus aquaticus]
MVKPPALKVGDKVAIVSLSSGVLGEAFCRHELKKGKERLLEMGLKPIFMPNALKGIEYLAKHPESRAEDLKTAFLDDSIRGIICAIGGDDTYRLAPYLLEDESFKKVVKTNPKLFTGFSDTTINHLMFYSLGMTTFYGPNFINDLAELDSDMLSYTKKYFLNYLKKTNHLEIRSSHYWYEERKDFSENALETARVKHRETKGYEILRGRGIVTGKLLGGCLDSFYNILVGERHIGEKQLVEKYRLFPSVDEWKNKIIFLETSEEKPNPTLYRKMLTALKKRGVFAAVNAIIVGKPQNEIFYDEYKKAITDITAETKTPILFNVNFGHAYPRTVLPYGLEAKIDFDQKRIVINESLFATGPANHLNS